MKKNYGSCLDGTTDQLAHILPKLFRWIRHTDYTSPNTTLRRLKSSSQFLYLFLTKLDSFPLSERVRSIYKRSSICDSYWKQNSLFVKPNTNWVSDNNLSEILVILVRGRAHQGARLTFGARWIELSDPSSRNPLTEQSRFGVPFLAQRSNYRWKMRERSKAARKKDKKIARAHQIITQSSLNKFGTREARHSRPWIRDNGSNFVSILAQNFHGDDDEVQFPWAQVHKGRCCTLAHLLQSHVSSFSHLCN